jgi:hypothetical protein
MTELRFALRRTESWARLYDYAMSRPFARFAVARRVAVKDGASSAVREHGGTLSAIGLQFD